MNLGQLRQVNRDALDDNSSPPLYSDAELDRWANNAVTEAVLRARLLQEDTGDATRIAIEADTARYDLTREILVVRAVHISGRKLPLIRTTSERLDRIHPGWSHEETLTSTPEYVVFDVQQKTVTLFPTPAAAATLFLRVWRLPTDAEKMEDDSDEPCVYLPDPESLKDWVLHEAYLKKDGELYDPEKSAAHLALFAERYGERPSVHELALWSTQPITGPRHKQLDY